MPLLSYIDKRFGGDGKAYLKSGWTLDGEGHPPQLKTGPDLDIDK